MYLLELQIQIVHKPRRCVAMLSLWWLLLSFLMIVFLETSVVPWISMFGPMIWYISYHFTSLFCYTGFPNNSDGKESTCIVGDLGSIPGLGRSPGEGKGYPLQYSRKASHSSILLYCILGWLQRYAKHGKGWKYSFDLTKDFGEIGRASCRERV